MSRMANGSEFRNKLEERLGTERYEELAQTGQQDKREDDKYSAAEVIAKFRERPKDVSVNEGDNSMVARFQDYVDSGKKFNNKARDYLITQGVDFGDKVRKEVPVRDSTPTPIAPTITDSVGSSIGDNINTGNTIAASGSIVNSPVGNNNYISTNVDNSTRGTEDSNKYYSTNLDDFKFDVDDFKKSYMAKLLA